MSFHNDKNKSKVNNSVVNSKKKRQPQGKIKPLTIVLVRWSTDPFLLFSKVHLNYSYFSSWQHKSIIKKNEASPISGDWWHETSGWL